MSEYVPLVGLGVIVVLMTAALPVVSSLLGRSRPSERKLMPYECGIIPEQEAIGPVPIKFSLTCMSFLIFDIELVFLYPWAAAYGKLGLYGFFAMLVFVAILAVGYLYEWKRGAFDWER